MASLPFILDTDFSFVTSLIVEISLILTNVFPSPDSPGDGTTGISKFLRSFADVTEPLITADCSSSSTTCKPNGASLLMDWI